MSEVSGENPQPDKQIEIEKPIEEAPSGQSAESNNSSQDTEGILFLMNVDAEKKEIEKLVEGMTLEDQQNSPT